MVPSRYDEVRRPWQPCSPSEKTIGAQQMKPPIVYIPINNGLSTSEPLDHSGTFICIGLPMHTRVLPHHARERGDNAIYPLHDRALQGDKAHKSARTRTTNLSRKYVDVGIHTPANDNISTTVAMDSIINQRGDTRGLFLAQELLWLERHQSPVRRNSCEGGRRSLPDRRQEKSIRWADVEAQHLAQKDVGTENPDL